MFIEPTITWVPSGFSGYIWLDTKIVLKKKLSVKCSRQIQEKEWRDPTMIHYKDEDLVNFEKSNFSRMKDSASRLI